MMTKKKLQHQWMRRRQTPRLVLPNELWGSSIQLGFDIFVATQALDWSSTTEALWMLEKPFAWEADHKERSEDINAKRLFVSYSESMRHLYRGQTWGWCSHRSVCRKDCRRCIGGLRMLQDHRWSGGSGRCRGSRSLGGPHCGRGCWPGRRERSWSGSTRQAQWRLCSRSWREVQWRHSHG